MNLEVSGMENKREKNISPEEKYYQWSEKYFENKRGKIKTIPESERAIEPVGEYGYKMKIKDMSDIPASSPTEPRYKDNNRFRAVEYFVDFDDTLFNTTGYFNAVFAQLEALNLTREEIVDLYESSKVPNEKTGEKMYRQDVFIEKLEKHSPGQTELIQKAFSNISLDDFVHEDMARLMKILTASPSSRVHILTYGDISVQQPKVEAVLKKYGIPMDVLYTQAPKSEFLSQYIPEQYPYVKDENHNSQNFIVIDDSADELRKLMETSKEIPYFTPIRLRKPEAKKSKKEQEGNPAYEVANDYEFILYEATRILRPLRDFGEITPEEWSERNIAENIGKHIERLKMDKNTFKLRDGKDSTLIISRHIRSFSDSDKFIDFEIEIGFDEASNKMYEVARDPEGKIINKKEYIPFYSDIIKSKN